MANELNPFNDLVRTFQVYDIDPVTYQQTPAIAGTVQAFIATSRDPGAVAAHASLSVACTYVGGQGSPPHPVGTWGFEIDAAVLTPTLLDPLFPTGTDPHIIVQRPGAVRVYERLKYVPARAARV